MFKVNNIDIRTTPTHSAFACSKLTIGTLEHGVKYVQSNNKATRTTPLATAVVLVSLLLTLNIFHTLF